MEPAVVAGDDVACDEEGPDHSEDDLASAAPECVEEDWEEAVAREDTTLTPAQVRVMTDRTAALATQAPMV